MVAIGCTEWAANVFLENRIGSHFRLTDTMMQNYGNVRPMVGRCEKLAGTNADNSARHVSLKSRKGSSAPLSIMVRNSGSVLFGAS